MGDKDDMPDYHYERLTKMSNDNEKKGTIHAVNLRSFGPEAEIILPDSDSMSYKVPNMIILIDQDIKSLWQEQTVIKNRLEKIRSLNNGVIEKIYQEYQDSLAGKKFQHSSAQTRYQMKDVCHQCYRFYLALFKEVVTPNGRIKNDTLHRLSDPLYQLGQDKVKKFDEISRDIRKSFQRKVVDVSQPNTGNLKAEETPGSSKKINDESPKRSSIKRTTSSKKLLLGKNDSISNSQMKPSANSNQRQSIVTLHLRSKEILDSSSKRISILFQHGKPSDSQSVPRNRSSLLATPTHKDAQGAGNRNGLHARRHS